MSRLRRCLRWALAVLCFAGLPTAAPAEVAWWLTERFTPAQTSYEGLSARELHPKWVKFSILSNAALPAKAKPDLEWMRKRPGVHTRGRLQPERASRPRRHGRVPGRCRTLWAVPTRPGREPGPLAQGLSFDLALALSRAERATSSLPVARTKRAKTP